jgi:hypothetical protein
MRSSRARTGFEGAFDIYRRLRRRPLLLNLRSLLQLIPFKPLDVNCLYFLEHAGVPAEHPGVFRGRANIRTGTLEDLEGLTQCQDRRLEFLNRFAANDLCAVAVLDGRIVGYQWFCVRPLYREERYSCAIEVPPDAVYEYDIFILPEHRLTGLWFKFHCGYLRELMGRLHRRRVIGIVDYGEHLAMNTHLRFGFTLFRRAVIVKILGRSICLAGALRGDRASLPRWISGSERAGAPSREAAATKPPLGATNTRPI